MWGKLNIGGVWAGFTSRSFAFDSWLCNFSRASIEGYEFGVGMREELTGRSTRMKAEVGVRNAAVGLSMLLEPFEATRSACRE